MSNRRQLVAVKPVGAMGRVVIPADVRRTRGMEPGTEIGIYVEGDAVILLSLPALRMPKKTNSQYRRPGDD